MIDRLLFTVCYGVLGLILGFSVALSVAKYLNTSYASLSIIVAVSLLCALVGFIAPNIISRCYNRIWLSMRD